MNFPTYENPTNYPAQSVVDSTDFAAITAGSALTGVISGCAVTPSSGMTVGIASGVIAIAGFSYSANSGTVVVSAASTGDRRDIVYATWSGSAVVYNYLAGNASTTANWQFTNDSAAPIKPNLPANAVLLAEIYVEGTNATPTTSITTNEILDKRVIVSLAVTGQTDIFTGTLPPGNTLMLWLNTAAAGNGTQGPTGPAPTATIGTVTGTGPTGSPSVSVSQTGNTFALSFVLQQGATGAQGANGSIYEIPPTQHVNPYGLTMQGWTYDPVFSGLTGATASFGTVYYNSLYIPAGSVCNWFAYYLTATGANISNIYVGLYGTDGQTLLTSGNASGNIATYNNIQFSSSYTTATSGVYWAAFLCVGTGATPPTLLKSEVTSSSILNMNTKAGTPTIGTLYGRSNTSASNSSNLYANLGSSSVALTSGSNYFWFGVHN